MTAVMAAERVRLTVLVPPEIRTALRLEAAYRNMEMSDLIEELIRTGCPDAVKDALRRQKADQASSDD